VEPTEQDYVAEKILEEIMEVMILAVEWHKRPLVREYGVEGTIHCDRCKAYVGEIYFQTKQPPFLVLCGECARLGTDHDARGFLR